MIMLIQWSYTFPLRAGRWVSSDPTYLMPLKHKVTFSEMFLPAWRSWSFVCKFFIYQLGTLYQRVSAYPFIGCVGKGKERRL